MYAFLSQWDPMYTPPFTGVRIGYHLNRNAFMHGQTTIGIHEEEVPKLVYRKKLLFYQKIIDTVVLW